MSKIVNTKYCKLQSILKNINLEKLESGKGIDYDDLFSTLTKPRPRLLNIIWKEIIFHYYNRTICTIINKVTVIRMKIVRTKIEKLIEIKEKNG